MTMNDTTTTPTEAGEKMTAPEIRFATKKDVAKFLQLSVRTIDNLLRQGLPHLKLGKRRCRFDMVEVRQWCKEQFGTQRRATPKVD